MSGTVLIIDDSPIIREKVRDVLNDEGLFDNYVEADDGMKGYKALFEHSVSIVICDVMMPGVDGFKFLSLKNSHEEFKTVPVIMLTGQADTKTLVKALHSGASDYIVKPFEDEELLARIRVHNSLRESQDDLIKARDELETSHKQIHSIIEAIPEGLLVLDSDETILMANQPIADVLGYPTEVHLIGKDFKSLLADGDLLKLTGLEKPVEGAPVVGMTASFVTESGTTVPLSISCSAMRKENLDIESYVVVSRDIRESQVVHIAESRALAAEKQASLNLQEENEELTEQTYKDSLTGLWNRHFLMETIEKDIARINRHYGAPGVDTNEDGPCLIFAMVDIDHFKDINDQYGHRVGDLVLQKVARLLEEVGRTSDTITRWGGEEFLLVGRNLKSNEAYRWAERICEAFRGGEFTTDSSQVVNFTCSVGFASYPFISASPLAVPWQGVVSIADEALYAAKNSGRNQWVGLFCTSSTPNELEAEGIREKLQGLLEEKKLDVISEQDSSELKWF